MSVMVVFSCALGMLLAAANLFYRDVRFIVDAVLTFGIFFTPVFYETTMLGKPGTILLLNPVAVILEALNDCVVHHQAPNIGWVSYAAILSLIGIWFSVNVFKTLEPMFAENI
jgi:ABC-type polysaccharide/polyol phosphate export permease